MEKRYLNNPIIIPIIALLVCMNFSCNRIDSHIQKGSTNLDLGDYKRARTHFEAVLELDPTNFNARLGLAKSLLQQYSTHPADSVIVFDCITQLEAARTLRPDKEVEKLLSLIWFKKANILLSYKDTITAIAALSRSTGFDPTATGPINLAGILYFNRGDREKALNLFRMVIATDTSSGQGYFNTGMVFWADSNFAAAYEYFFKAALHSPDDKEILTWAAQAKKKADSSSASVAGLEKEPLLSQKGSGNMVQ
jgi:tetratricopeptide (TPR) repeat protein